jgi:regulator of cell morphogenesis and NO signaling
MTITESTTVAEIASTLPASVRLFQRHGIDFCCGGRTPLAVACEQQGLSFTDVARDLEALETAPAPESREWAKEPLPALIDHILKTYHAPLGEELPRLESMASRVAHVHGSRASFLHALEKAVLELSSELRGHMRKEELVLFPAIRSIVAGESAMPVSAPIQVMQDEHDDAGALLAEMRRLTGNYEAPEWACGTFRALYAGLAELESEMHMHVHLENNILFPRALGKARN